MDAVDSQRILLLMAYAGLRWWLCGQEAGHRAHDYAALEMDALRLRGNVSAEVERLELALWLRLRRPGADPLIRLD